MRRALLVACVLALAGCGGGEEAAREPAPSPQPTLPAEFLDLYDYDTAPPFTVEEVKTEEKDGATVHDLSYAGPGGRITAYFVVPEGDGPFPAVLFMPGAPGARFTFHTESIDLAQRGIASLLPDPPYSRNGEDVVEFKPDDKDGIIQEVTEMRRGIDFLILAGGSRRQPARVRRLQLGRIPGRHLRGGRAPRELLRPHVPGAATERGHAPPRREQGAGDLSAYEEAMRSIDAVNYLPTRRSGLDPSPVR